MPGCFDRAGIKNLCWVILGVGLFQALFNGEWLLLVAMILGMALTGAFLEGRI
jgi:hypothetical protein